MKKAILGSCGIEVSRLGMGVMPIGPNQLALPLDEGAAIVRYALEAGIDFLDTAQYYHTYPYIREALRGGRLRPVISSKSLAPDRKGMEQAIEEARLALDLDVIDIFLLHEVRSGDFALRIGAWEALQEARARGVVRAIGVSTHNVDVTAAMAKEDECDVVFPLINYAGLGIRNGSRAGTAAEMLTAIEACHAAGKGVYAMKVFGGGNLTVSYQQALDFVSAQACIDALMIGFGSQADVDDALSYIEGRMPAGYNPDVSRKKMIVEQTNCEGCGACMSMCESEALFFNKDGLAQIDESRCLTCGYCAPVCPSRAIILY